MAEVALYIGDTGCGKTTAARNFDPAKTLMITPNSKSLPFPNGPQYKVGVNLIQTSELDDIAGTIKHVSDNMPNINLIILEDYTHFFNARIFSPKFQSRNQGGEAFARWMDFGASVFQSIISTQLDWRQDLIILVHHHVELKDTGTIGFKSAGKLLDKSIVVPSYVNYLFHGYAMADEAGVTRYKVLTQTDGVREAKTPPGLFPQVLTNDMAPIMDRMRDYITGKITIEPVYT